MINFTKRRSQYIVILLLLSLWSQLRSGETVFVGVMGTEIKDVNMFFPINLLDLAIVHKDKQIANVTTVYDRDGKFNEESKKDLSDLSVRIQLNDKKGNLKDYAFSRIVNGKMMLMFNDGETKTPEMELDDAPMLFSEVLGRLKTMKDGDEFTACTIDMRERRGDVWRYKKEGKAKIQDMNHANIFVDRYSITGKHGNIGDIYVSIEDNATPVRIDRIWREKTFITFFFK